MRVNHKRLDKLIEFDCGKLEISSFLFLVPIVGDEALSSGTTFLVSSMEKEGYVGVLRTSLFLEVMLKKMASLSKQICVRYKISGKPSF